MKEPINLYTREELIARLEIDKLSLDAWEAAGLIRPAGRFEHDTSYYSDDHLEQCRKIQALVDLGFDLEAVKKIKNKVGLPSHESGKGRNQEKLMTIGEIAEKIGVSPRTLKYWEEKELICPDSRSEGGFRLYGESFVEICRRIKELQLFGYSLEELRHMGILLLPQEHLREELAAYGMDEASEAIERLSSEHRSLVEKIVGLRKALDRWETITRSQAKIISRFLLQQAGGAGKKA